MVFNYINQESYSRTLLKLNRLEDQLFETKSESKKFAEEMEVLGKKNENLTKENAELQDVVSAFKTQVLNPRLNTYTYR